MLLHLQDVVAIQRILLAQYGAFPQNGDQLYEDIVSSAAIVSTGCPRWIPGFQPISFSVYAI